MIYPSFIDHLVFRVADVSRTEDFYTKILGQPVHREEHVVVYLVGTTRLFFTGVHNGEAEPHEKERVGLNHLAFGVRTLAELQKTKAQLDSLGVAHSGIKHDAYGHKDFIWLDDPDEMRVEFYLRPL